MIQRTILITAYPVIRTITGSLAIELSIGKACPSRRYNITNTAGCQAALELFAKELESTGKAWRLLVSFDKSSGRRPNGFNQAHNAGELRRDVNTHLVSEEAA